MPIRNPFVIAVMAITILAIIASILMMNNNNGQPSPPVVRPATQANRFYVGNAQKLGREVDSLLALHSYGDLSDSVAALIVPHAGYYFSGGVAASAYKRLNPKKRYQRVFLLGPSHYVWLDGASVNIGADYYATPLGNVKVDTETARVLMEADSLFSYREEAHSREHCLEVQLPFLQRRLGDVPPIVPIIISTNDYSKLQRMAEVLKPYFNEENLFIVSSDFSHYPSYDDAVEADALTGKALESGIAEQFIAAIEANARSGKPHLETSACGEYAIITLLLMLDRHYEVKHLLYQNSGDIDHHDHNRVVGYHSFAIVRHEKALPVSEQTGADSAHSTPVSALSGSDFVLTEHDKQQLKQIALQSIQEVLGVKSDSPATGSSAIGFSDNNTQPSVLDKKCGAFVSLHKHGDLQGCMGHFGEDIPLRQVVAKMAQAAAFDDPRFHPLRRHELDDVDIEISVLTPMRRIYSLDEFELHRHGLYIHKGRRSGTFLPQVADQVDWTKEEFVGHCSRDKAGLGWNGWRDAELYVYEAIVF